MSENQKFQTSDDTAQRGVRLFPIDALRGLIMVLMALSLIKAIYNDSRRESAGIDPYGEPDPNLGATADTPAE